MKRRDGLGAGGGRRRTRALLPLVAPLLACLVACVIHAAAEQDAAGLARNATLAPTPSSGGGASLQASSPVRHLLATCPPFPLTIENACSVLRVRAAVRAQLPQDIADASFCVNKATRAGQWCTRLWFDLEPGATATPFVNLTNSEFFAYAQAVNGSGSWSGNDTEPLISLTTGEPCSVESADCQHFYQSQALRTSDGSCRPSWTNSLTCTDDEAAAAGTCAVSLFFQNKCRYQIRFAVRARLNNNEDPGFCLGGNRTRGEWCTRAWFDLPPGQTTPEQLLQMNSNEFYYVADANDEKGRQIIWQGSKSEPGTAYFNTATGAPCAPESSADCRPFEMNSVSCDGNHTARLSCPNIVECDIPNCQTFMPDAQKCVCTGCSPGYWGSQCSECSNPNCLSYSSTCSCSSCSAGYQLRSGSCTACTVPNCESYQPGDVCTCSACSTGYRLNGGTCEQSQCSVPNCQAYSASSGCSCTACIPGYRLASGSCQPCGVSNCQAYSASGECSCSSCAAGYNATGGACVQAAGVNSSSGSSNVGVIAGAAAGAAVAVAAVAAVAVFWYHRRRKRQAPPDEELKPNVDSLLVPPSGPSGRGGGPGGMGYLGYPPAGATATFGAVYPHSPGSQTGAGSPLSTAAGSAAGTSGTAGTARTAGQQLQSLGPSPFASAYPAEQATLVGVPDMQPEPGLGTFPTRPGGTPPESIASLQYAAGAAAGLGAAAGMAAPQSLSAGSGGASLHSGPGSGASPRLSAAGSAGTAAAATAGSAGMTPRSAAGSAGTAAAVTAGSAGTAPHLSAAGSAGMAAAATAGSAGVVPRSSIATAGTSPPSSLLLAGLSAPTTPSVPSRGGASGQLSGRTSGFGSGGSHDPLMTYLQSQVVPGGATRTGSQPHTPGSPGGVDVRPWEVRFDELQIIKPVGEGSFGRVYLAEWFSTQVAVKVLIVGHVATASEAQRALSLSVPILHKLEAEASLLASLRHPNVVNFLGICHDPPCILTEFCARGSLAEVLAAGRTDPAAAAQLTWARRLSMAANAASGMLYLHSRPAPIVHRDLKSPNLLVDANWVAKVTDFNLSKILEDTTHSSSMAAMNPRWLAPELMQGQRATKASDVYAFGIVLWELLTWHLPWGTSNPWQLVSHVVAGGRLEVPPRHALPGPDTVAFAGLDGYISLMQRCWAQSPEERPGFQQIVVELRALLDQVPPAW